jgi:hypothetical protein
MTWMPKQTGMQTAFKSVSLSPNCHFVDTDQIVIDNSQELADFMSAGAYGV